MEKKKLLEIEKQLDALMKERQTLSHNNECLQRKYDDLDKLLVAKTNECCDLMEKASSSKQSQEVIAKLNEKIVNMEKENQRLMKDVQKLRDLIEVCI